MTPAWRVWRALDDPPNDHPLYRLSQRQPRTADGGCLKRLLLPLLALVVLLALSGQILALVYGLLLLILGSPLLFFVLGGTLGGAWTAAQTAAQVVRWCRRAASLVEVTPLGADGSAWIVGLAQANARQRRMMSWRYARWLSGVLVLMLLFIQASASLDASFSTIQQRLWVDTLAYLTLTLILLLDHVYAPVNGLLVGLLVGLKPGPLLRPSIGAGLVFLAWQGLVTFGLGLGWIGPLRSLIAQTGLSLSQQAFLNGLGLLLAFTVWREALTALLLWGFRRMTAR